MQLHEPIYNFKIDECQKNIEGSVFFSLNPITQKAAYNREKEKLIKELIEYAFALDEAVNVNYGGQIWDLALRCLKYYDINSGIPFLHYFNRALKKDKNKWIAEEIREAHVNGMGIPEDKYLIVRKHIKWAAKEFIPTNSPQFINIVSDSLRVTPVEATQIIDIVEHGIQQQYVSNSDGEEYDVIDIDRSHNYQESAGSTQNELLNSKIDIIESQFKVLQERTKVLIGKLLTSKLYELMLANIDVGEYIRMQTFFDEETYAMCCEFKREVTAKEIAEKLGLAEASVSRSWKTFQDRIIF